MPTLKGKRAACDWINNVMHVPVTMNFVVTNANAKRIRRKKIGAALYFSTQDLYEFVMTQVVEQTGAYMPTESSAALTLNAGNSPATRRD